MEKGVEERLGVESPSWFLPDLVTLKWRPVLSPEENSSVISCLVLIPRGARDAAPTVFILHASLSYPPSRVHHSSCRQGSGHCIHLYLSPHFSKTLLSYFFKCCFNQKAHLFICFILPLFLMNHWC